MGSRAALAISDIPAAQGVGEPSPSVVCERGAKAASSDKIMELAERAGALRNLELSPSPGTRHRRRTRRCVPHTDR
jgi:hypothetical protein